MVLVLWFFQDDAQLERYPYGCKLRTPTVSVRYLSGLDPPLARYEVQIIILGKNRFGVFALSTVSTDT